MVSKDYAPIPLLPTDKREFLLKFSARLRTVETRLTQLDILQIMTYLNGHNERLHGQLTRFIQACDQENNEKTDFLRKIPRRRNNELR